MRILQLAITFTFIIVNSVLWTSELIQAWEILRIAF